MSITTEMVLERIKEVKASIDDWNDKRKKPYRENAFTHMSQVKYSNMELQFQIGGTGNLDTFRLKRNLDKVLDPLGLRVKELRVFVPYESRHLDFWAILKSI